MVHGFRHVHDAEFHISDSSSSLATISCPVIATVKLPPSEFDHLLFVDNSLSKVSENVRPSVQRKCHSVMPRWYQMMA